MFYFLLLVLLVLRLFLVGFVGAAVFFEPVAAVDFLEEPEVAARFLDAVVALFLDVVFVSVLLVGGAAGACGLLRHGLGSDCHVDGPGPASLALVPCSSQ